LRQKIIDAYAAGGISQRNRKGKNVSVIGAVSLSGLLFNGVPWVRSIGLRSKAFFVALVQEHILIYSRHWRMRSQK